MERSTALGAAGGVTLAIAGAATALVMTVGGLATADPSSDQPAPAAVVTEYVDQYGNPVADPAATGPAAIATAPVIEVVDATTGAPVPTVVTTPTEPSSPATGYAAEYSETEHEEEYEDGEEYEDEEEYEDDEEYEEYEDEEEYGAEYGEEGEDDD